MEPTQTSFLQALNIPSKIARGQIEIINDVPLIMTGARVGTSEAALLAKLDIKPFKYGLVIKTVYDNGTVYDAAVLALTDEDILAKFHAGVRNIATIGLQIGYPTIASLPHSIIRGYKNVLSVALATDISFPAVDKIKHALANPTAHAPAAAKKEEAAPKEDKKKAKEEPKEEEAEEEMGFGLFD
jgi:large subunit ribosomal protein LP0